MNSFLLVNLILFVGTYSSMQVQQQKQFVILDNHVAVDIDAGESAEIKLPFRIQFGYHIQADTVNDENLIRAELSFNQIDGVQTGRPKFPDFKKFQLKGTDEKLLVFDGEMNILVPLSVDPSTKKGSYHLPGGLYYQACDSVRCLFPRRLEFQVVVNVK